MIERVAAGQDRNFFLRVQVVSMAGLSVETNRRFVYRGDRREYIVIEIAKAAKLKKCSCGQKFGGAAISGDAAGPSYSV